MGVPPTGRSARLTRRMGLLLATTAGLVVWLVLWALGTSGFDAFLITAVIVLIAATGRMLVPYLPNHDD